MNIVNLRQICLLFACLSASCGYLHANENGEDKPVTPVMHNGKPLNTESWHYYNTPAPEPEPETPEEKPKMAPLPAPSSTSSSADVVPMSVQWFQMHMDTIMQRAIDNPDDPQAIRAHLYAQKVMLDKAETFAHKVAYQQSIDPNLQEGVRTTIVGAARADAVHKRTQIAKEALSEIFKTTGLILFFDPQCMWCHRMVSTANSIKIEFPHVDLRVNTIGDSTKIKHLRKDIPVYIDNGLVDLFQVTRYPTLAMYNPPDDVYIVSQGLMFFSEARKRMINIAFDQGILDETWVDKVFEEQKGLISTDKLRAMPTDIADDPVKLINAVLDSMDPDFNPMNPKNDKPKTE